MIYFDKKDNKTLIMSDPVKDIIKAVDEASGCVNSREDVLKLLDLIAFLKDYSVSNCLLFLTKFPRATKVGNVTFWSSAGAGIKKGAEGIKVLSPLDKDSFDKSLAYELVYDITQTTKVKCAKVGYNKGKLLTALMKNAPCDISLSESLDENTLSALDSDDDRIILSSGATDEELIYSFLYQIIYYNLVRDEIADGFISDCICYIVCRRLGINNLTFVNMTPDGEAIKKENVIRFFGKIKRGADYYYEQIKKSI